MTENTKGRYKLSISNIAWPPESDDLAITLAADLGFQGIEVAPVKVFGDLAEVDWANVRAYRNYLRGFDLQISALQGILYGSQHASLFRSEATRYHMMTRLKRVAELAYELGAGVCVFGAPTLRDPGEIPFKSAESIAIDFFSTVAEFYAQYGVKLCFEANPLLYNCHFITHSTEAFRLVEAVNKPCFAMQLDTGTIFINKEDPAFIIEAAPRIGHVHISEPALVPLGTSSVCHSDIGEALRRTPYSQWISIEMKASPEWQTTVATAHRVLTQHYV